MTTSELIGVFDSGVGGLTVAERLQEALPALSFIYYGDTAHVPYGDREAKEVVWLIDKICRHLLQSGAQALVMACNTSSALAYEHVLSWSPRPVIGIIAEAAEAAAQATREGKVGIMANPLTAASGAYERELVRQAERHELGCVEGKAIGCPRLVPFIERGEVEGPAVEEALRAYWQPLERWGADTLILGCTHYPFLRPVLSKLVGPEVTIIDPAYYVAKRLQSLGLGNGAGQRQISYQVSGDPQDFARVGAQLLGRPLEPVIQVKL